MKSNYLDSSVGQWVKSFRKINFHTEFSKLSIVIMSQSFVILKLPKEIDEFYTLIKWVEKSIEGNPKVKSILECEDEIREFTRSLDGLAPTIDVYPKDIEVKLTVAETTPSWQSIYCCNRNLVEVDFGIEQSFLDRKGKSFEKKLLSLAEKLGLYVIYDSEIVIGQKLQVDPKKSPDYRENKAKVKVIENLPKLSEKFNSVIEASVTLTHPIKYKFVDHFQHPRIGIICADEDYANVYRSFDRFCSGLYLHLRKVTKSDINFQILKASQVKE